MHSPWEAVPSADTNKNQSTLKRSLLSELELRISESSEQAGERLISRSLAVGSTSATVDPLLVPLVPQRDDKIGVTSENVPLLSSATPIFLEAPAGEGEHMERAASSASVGRGLEGSNDGNNDGGNGVCVETDLEANVEERSCRICLEAGGDEGGDGDGLIAPCRCKGTQQYVHRACLDHWRAVKEGFAFAHCTTCKAQFHLRVPVEDENQLRARRRRFHFFVTRDLCLVFLAVQATIAVLGLLVAALDGKREVVQAYEWSSHHRVLFYYFCGLFVFLVLFGVGGFIVHAFYGSRLDMGPYGGACVGNCGSELALGAGGCGELLLLAIVVFAVLGAVYGVLAAILAWQQIWQRHYHIRAKAALAEEYVVEDLHGCYTVPELRKEDEEKLRSLKLLE
eukprot:TRINITY_DN26564_c0_g1_i1.p1 TRINITY_DN26564_c0_g1~~TRINITY_DN26564_c0_g1_i1.p1  ORF type:complete len:396 (+),score=76.36 TRINITY_DN26564_c0_g1_i1:229-1416(+)